MASRVKMKRTSAKLDTGNDDSKLSPKKKLPAPSKTRMRQSTKKTSRQTKLEPKDSKVKKKLVEKKPKVSTKKIKKVKDSRAFSSYFEKKRATVTYNYHISPTAQVCVSNPTENIQQEKGILKSKQRKRKADIFDYCSDEEVVLASKKSKTVSSDQGDEKKVANGRNSKKSKQNPAKVKGSKVTPAIKTSKTVAKSASASSKKVTSPKKAAVSRKTTSRKTSLASKKKDEIKTVSTTTPVGKSKQQVGKGKRKRKAVSMKKRTSNKKSKQQSDETINLDYVPKEVVKVLPNAKCENEASVNVPGGEESKEASLNTDQCTQVCDEGDNQSTMQNNEELDDMNEVKLESHINDIRKESDVTNNSVMKEEEGVIEDAVNEEENIVENSADSRVVIDLDEEEKSADDTSEICLIVNEEGHKTDKNSSKATVNLQSVSCSRQPLECSADISVNETEENFKRKSFDHQLKVGPQDVPSLTRCSTWPKTAVSTSLSITSNQPVTVVRNVRQAHECLQHGENIQFRDQVEYLIDGMRSSQPLSLRCLSTLSLATECLKSEFCRQLRAHGLVYKIMILLKDALQNPSLQIAAATLFFVISLDRIDGSDLDRTCLELLLGLMKSTFDDPSASEDYPVEDSQVLEGKAKREYEKIKAKAQLVLEKCPMLPVTEKVKGQSVEDVEKVIDESNVGESIQNGIKPADLSICELICECFHNITSTQSSCNWIKEEMRILGILDVIANKAIQMIELIDKDRSTKEPFTKVLRILKLLENVTFMNKGNQSYLTVFDGSLLISKLCSCLILLKDLIVSDNDNRLLFLDGLLGVLRVLLNLTHDHELGSFRVGEQTRILESVLECVFQIPDSCTEEKGFDLLILSLGLLINLVEHSAPNRELFYNTQVEVHTSGNKNLKSAIEAVTELFLTNYKKSKETTIDVPTPQNLSQRTPTASPMKATLSPNVKKDTTVPLASRLKSHKDIKGYRSPANFKDSEGNERGDGMDWLPNDESEESEDEEEEMQISDSLVFNREDFDTALTQAGKHMEDSIAASYSALLLAILAKYSTVFAESLKKDLPQNNFSSLVSVLKEFIDFMTMAGTGTNRSGLESIKKIVKHIERLEDTR